MGASQEWSLPAGTAEVVRRRLQDVLDPCSVASVLPMSIVELGLVRDVEVVEGALLVHLRLTSPSCMMVAYIAREVVERLADLPGVDRVEVVPDEGLDWDPSHMDGEVAHRRQQRLVLLAAPPAQLS